MLLDAIWVEVMAHSKPRPQVSGPTHYYRIGLAALSNTLVNLVSPCRDVRWVWSGV